VGAFWRGVGIGGGSLGSLVSWGFSIPSSFGCYFFPHAMADPPDLALWGVVWAIMFLCLPMVKRWNLYWRPFMGISKIYHVDVIR